MQWERCLTLQNHRTAMDRSQVDLVYVERLADGGEREHDGAEAVLALTSVAVDRADPGPLSRPQPHRAAALGGAGVFLGRPTASTS